MESCVTRGCHGVNILAQSSYNLIYKRMNLIPVRSLVDLPAYSTSQISI